MVSEEPVQGAAPPCVTRSTVCAAPERISLQSPRLSTDAGLLDILEEGFGVSLSGALMRLCNTGQRARALLYFKSCLFSSPERGKSGSPISKLKAD